MALFKLLWIIVLFIMLKTIYARRYEECRGVNKPNTAVASKKSCSKYIICNGDESYEGECLAGNYFNEKEGNCDEPENVPCNIEPNDDIKSIYDVDYNPNVSQIESTDNNGGGEDGADENSAESITDSEIEDMNGNGYNMVSVPLQQQPSLKCSQLSGSQKIKNIANPESCVTFYTCYNGLAIPMLCSGKMYFNERSGKCETEMPQSCKLRLSLHFNCHKGIYDFIPHPHRCEYYFYCSNGYLMILRCPPDFTWNYEQRTCVHKSKSKCYFEQSVIYRNDN
ncbi:uncharacterized protein ACRADG_009675 [Cochliomyia hominivorax]